MRHFLLRDYGLIHLEFLINSFKILKQFHLLPPLLRHFLGHLISQNILERLVTIFGKPIKLRRATSSIRWIT